MVAEAVQDPPVNRVGLGYQMRVPEIGVAFTLTRVRRRSDEVTGYLKVQARIAGVKTFNDHVLMIGNLNVLGTRVRKDWAVALRDRTPGIDIDWAYLLNHFAERVVALEQQGEPILEIGSRPVPRTSGTYALKPLVPRSGASLFYAPGGSGKSQFGIGAALSWTLGREIIPGISPTIKGPALYLDWETDPDTFAERVQRMCRGVGVEPVDILYRRCTRALADDAEELTGVIAYRGVVALVVDSCGPAMGQQGEYGDASESTNRLFDALRLINLPTLIIDHVSKQEMTMNGKKRGKLPYGSIYKINRSRMAWEVRPVTTLSDETIIVGLHHTKSNDSRLLDPIGLQIAFDNSENPTTTFASHEGSLEPQEDDDGGSGYSPVSTTESKIAELLEDHRLTSTDIAKYLGLSHGTVRSTLHRKGDVFVKGEDQRWTKR